MIGYLGSLQKRAEGDYDTQIFRAQAQREAKELREEQEKLDKQKRMQDSIVKHRQETVRDEMLLFTQSISIHLQVKRREADREIQEREDAEMRRKKAETDQLFNLYQQEKDRQRHHDSQLLSNMHLKQAVSICLSLAIGHALSLHLQQERKDRERGLKDSEVEEVLLDKHMNDVDKQQFQDYAERVISYMDENGRNTYPLKKVAFHHR